MAKLRAEFWKKEAWLEDRRVVNGERLFWEGLLSRKQRAREFRAMFGDFTPWQVSKLVRRYFVLIDGLTDERDIIDFLGHTFWPTCVVGGNHETPSRTARPSSKEEKRRQCPRYHVGRH